MKKILFFAAVAAIAASCVNENYDAEKVVLKASIEETKTTLVDGVKTHWTAGDQLSVFNSEKGNCIFTTNISAPSKTAEFTYMGGEEYFLKPEVYHAFYPYSKAIKTEDFATFTGLEIPTIQTPVAGGFDPKAALCYGKGQSANVAFQNLTALIKFTVAADEVYNVKVVGTGANLAGAATFDGTALVATEAAAQLKGNMRKDKTFYLAVAPGTFATLKVFVNGIELTEKARTNKTLEAGNIYDMGNVTNLRTLIAEYNVEASPTTFTEDQLSSLNWTYDVKDETSYDYSKKYPFKQEKANYIYFVSEDASKMVNAADGELKPNLRSAFYKGQYYSLIYNPYDGMHLFFNIDWESNYNGAENVYEVIDIQDRELYYQYISNRSYYDATAKKLVINYAALEGTTLKYIHGTLTEKTE